MFALFEKGHEFSLVQFVSGAWIDIQIDKQKDLL